MLAQTMKSGRIIYRDHAMAGSSHGHGGECYCGKEEGVGGVGDIAALAAGAIAAFLIYQAITMAAGRRRKRENVPSPFEAVKDVIFTGKIDGKNPL